MMHPHWGSSSATSMVTCVTQQLRIPARMRRSIPLLLTLALVSSLSPALAERIEFDAGPGASTPSLTVDPDRGLVLTWQTRTDKGAALHYALFDDHGREMRRGIVAEGSDWFVNWADFPSLAVLGNKTWVTYWLQKSAPDSYAYDIHLVHSSNGGGRWSEPLIPHDDGTPTEHGFVSMVPLDDSRVQLLWLDGRNSVTASAADAVGHEHEGAMSVRGAVVDWQERIEEPIELDPRSCSCCQTDAARIGARTLVVYRDRSEDEVRDIALVERDPDGHWSAPEIVHADGWKISACPVNGPTIAANGARALIVWPTLAQAPMSVRYVLREGASNSPMQVLEQGEAVLGRVDSSAAADDGFAISWIGAGKSGSALKLATLDAQGKLLGIREVMALAAGRSSGNPRLAWYHGAHFLTWTEVSGPGQTAIALERIEP
jgi:hypothetical protein